MKIEEKIITALEGLQMGMRDVKHIAKCLLRVGESQRRELVQGYRSEWRRAYDEEPDGVKKNNAAIRAANLWIEEQTANQEPEGERT